MGKFDTHGGVFAPQGIMKIEAGGTHEENPNGGVQVGVDPEGIPNMLEENETVYQDFVYSDSIVADGNILKEFNLPEKFGGKKYSEIVDQYVDEERPNDAIANNGMNAMLVRLANAQEEQKKRAEMKELEDELSKLTPEQLDELETMVSQQENPGEYAEAETADDATMFDAGGWMQKYHPDEKVPASFIQAMEAYVKSRGIGPEVKDSIKYKDAYRAVKFGSGNIVTTDRGKNLRSYHYDEDTKQARKHFEQLVDLGMPKEDAFELAFPMVDETLLDKKNVNHDIKRYNVLSDARKNLFNELVGGTYKNYDVEVNLPDVDIVADKINPKEYEATSTEPAIAKPAVSSSGAREKVDFNKFLQTPVRGINYPNQSINVPSMLYAPELTAVPYDGPAYEGLSDREFNRSANEYTKQKASEATGDTSSRDLPIFPRYAGAITSGLLGLYNAFQRPDKYKIDRVRPTLSTTRLQTVDPVYRPIDANLAVNDVLASGAGTVSALRNSGLGPSQTAALLAADYNIGRNIGDARTRVADYNNNMYNNIVAQTNANRQAKAKIDLNRERNNTMLLYDASIRNAQNNLMQQRYNYDAEGQKYAALSNQIDQIAQALANIGYENFAMNQANNSGFDYRTGRNGTSYYVGGKRCGGLLKKYKR